MSTENWRVLLVDNDKSDRLAVRKALLQAAPGLHLDEATPAESPSPGDTYDCLIVAGDKSGVALIKDLRARGVTTPILALTAPADEPSEAAALAA